MDQTSKKKKKKKKKNSDIKSKLWILFFTILISQGWCIQIGGRSRQMQVRAEGQ